MQHRGSYMFATYLSPTAPLTPTFSWVAQMYFEGTPVRFTRSKQTLLLFLLCLVHFSGITRGSVHCCSPLTYSHRTDTGRNLGLFGTKFHRVMATWIHTLGLYCHIAGSTLSANTQILCERGFQSGPFILALSIGRASWTPSGDKLYPFTNHRGTLSS